MRGGKGVEGSLLPEGGGVSQNNKVIEKRIRHLTHYLATKGKGRGGFLLDRQGERNKRSLIGGRKKS